MDTFDISFKALAILHSIGGYFVSAFTMDEEFQEAFIYKDRNPLVGDVQKFLAITATWSLIACGIMAFYSPKFAVALAWISLALYGATWLVDAIAIKRLPSVCITCLGHFAVRLVAALALTYVYILASYA